MNAFDLGFKATWEWLISGRVGLPPSPSPDLLVDDIEAWWDGSNAAKAQINKPQVKHASVCKFAPIFIIGLLVGIGLSQAWSDNLVIATGLEIAAYLVYFFFCQSRK